MGPEQETGSTTAVNACWTEASLFSAYRQMIGLEGLHPGGGREEQGQRKIRKDILYGKEDVHTCPCEWSQKHPPCIQCCHNSINCDLFGQTRMKSWRLDVQRASLTSSAC